jgi:(S)-citramalyl-CoA lyase
LRSPRHYRRDAKGVGTIDGQMIDDAIARKAHRTLTAAGLKA